MALRFKFLNFLHRETNNNAQVQQVRYKFTDYRMLKDYKKRLDVAKYGKERLRINALRKNKILPPELKELADKEIAALPARSSITQIIYRCCLTSRARGVVTDYRISRIMFRHLADYNQLYGVIRAKW